MPRWAEIYREKCRTAADAVRVIESGQRLFITGNCSVPQVILKAFVERALELQDVELLQVLTVGEADYARPEFEGHVRVNSMFIAPNVRGAVNEGRADFTPVFLSEIPRLYREHLPIDVAVIQVSPPDEHGYCSFGIEVGVTKTAAEVARVVIAEVNPRMPRSLGDSFIHLSKIDLIVEVDYPLPEFAMSQPSDVQETIGRHVAELIEDGSTLQTGIGGIPDAVLHYLGNKQHLGIHTELFSDGVIDLVEQGIITNESKTLHPGKMVAGFVLGTQRLYDFIHDNPVVELHPSEYVNDPFLIAQNERMVAINSALEVDLTGQVCADSIGHSFYSGVGGQVDFMRGAARSKGGKPIIALPATAKGGSLSRIVWQLKPGSGVVTTRNEVHYIVTEFGVAYLYGKTIRERAEALIAVAHPDFREELEEQAHALNYLPPVYRSANLSGV